MGDVTPRERTGKGPRKGVWIEKNWGKVRNNLSHLWQQRQEFFLFLTLRILCILILYVIISLRQDSWRHRSWRQAFFVSIIIYVKIPDVIILDIKNSLCPFFMSRFLTTSFLMSRILCVHYSLGYVKILDVIILDVKIDLYKEEIPWGSQPIFKYSHEVLPVWKP